MMFIRKMHLHIIKESEMRTKQEYIESYGNWI